MDDEAKEQHKLESNVDGPAAALESEATPRGHSEQFIIQRGPDSITDDHENGMQRGSTE